MKKSLKLLILAQKMDAAGLRAWCEGSPWETLQVTGSENFQEDIGDVFLWIADPSADPVPESLNKVRDGLVKNRVPVMVFGPKGTLYSNEMESKAALVDIVTRETEKEEFLKKVGLVYEVRELKEKMVELSGTFAGKTSELVKALAENEKARDKMTELDKLKSDFTSMISHEIRTPISAMSGAVGTLNSGVLGDINPEQKEFLDIIGRNATRLRSLVTDFLDFSQLEAGKMSLYLKRVPVDTPVRECVRTFRQQAEDSGITLDLECAEGIPESELDSGKIIQVMNNLVSNALKFTESGGHVLVAVKEMPEGQIEVSVQDNGIGIEDKDVDLIFGKFSQVDNTATRKYGGTGLGLPISQGIIDAHDGKLWYEPAPDGGSIFKFTLPVKIGGGIE